MDGDESFTWLLCGETVSSFFEDVADGNALFKIQSHSDLGTENEYVETLINKEISFGFKTDRCSVFDNWVKSFRLEAITWNLKTREFFGFRFQTAYLSMTYFDKFLSRRSFNPDNSWAVRLLPVACLSLAGKMEEIEIPGLSELQIGEYSISSGLIKKMELLVLSTLGWKMGLITPFAFLHYFITRLCKDPPPNHIASTTVEFILAIMKEINIMEHRPSVIAAAATLVALDKGLNRNAVESKMNSIPCRGLLEMEDVFACYNQMQKLKVEKLKIQKKGGKLTDRLSTHLRPSDASENSSSITSATSSKRRRLAFDSLDQNYNLSDEKRT